MAFPQSDVGRLMVGTRGSVFWIRDEEKGSWIKRATFAVYFGEDDPRNTSEKVFTKKSFNNAEMIASIFAMKKALKDPKMKELVIVTDSEYIVAYAAYDRNLFQFGMHANLCNRNHFKRLRDAFAAKEKKVFWVHPNDPCLETGKPTPLINISPNYDNCSAEEKTEIAKKYQLLGQEALELARKAK